MHSVPRRDFMFAADAIDGWRKIGALPNRRTPVTT
jgi:hypothetical protein